MAGPNDAFVENKFETVVGGRLLPQYTPLEVLVELDNLSARVSTLSDQIDVITATIEKLSKPKKKKT